MLRTSRRVAGVGALVQCALVAAILAYFTLGASTLGLGNAGDDRLLQLHFEIEHEAFFVGSGLLTVALALSLGIFALGLQGGTSSPSLLVWMGTVAAMLACGFLLIGGMAMIAGVPELARLAAQSPEQALGAQVAGGLVGGVLLAASVLAYALFAITSGWAALRGHFSSSPAGVLGVALGLLLVAGLVVPFPQFGPLLGITAVIWTLWTGVVVLQTSGR